MKIESLYKLLVLNSKEKRKKQYHPLTFETEFCGEHPGIGVGRVGL